jgi:cell division protein FtsB
MKKIKVTIICTIFLFNAFILGREAAIGLDNALQLEASKKQVEKMMKNKEEKKQLIKDFSSEANKPKNI